jgi:hypothetical protein
MAGQIDLTLSLVFIFLFVVSIIGFSIGFANDTGADISITDDPEERLGSLYNSTKTGTNQLGEDSEDTYQSLLESTVEPGSDIIQSAGPFAITPANLIDISKNIIIAPRDVIFGGKGSQFGYIFTTFIAFLVLIFGLLLYKSLKGNP